MKSEVKRSWSLILRYVILVLIALPGLDLFYYIFLPLTVFPVYGFLDIFFQVSLQGHIIQIGELSIEIIDACVAGAAYYFLLILNLATPKIDVKRRLKIIGFSFGMFLIVNILRIILLSIIYLYMNPIYEFTHVFFWYLGSTIFIVAIWFFTVKEFGIKKIPFYSDLKFLYSKSYLKRK